MEYILENAYLTYRGSIPSALTIDHAVARTSATFKQADLVRAVKAARAAGLAVTATQITPDGTIRLFHTESITCPASDYDRFEAEL